MAQAGLVDRQRSTEDEGRVCVTLTDRGRALRGDAAAMTAKYGFAAKDARVLREMLTDPIDRMENV